MDTRELRPVNSSPLLLFPSRKVITLSSDHNLIILTGLIFKLGRVHIFTSLVSAAIGGNHLPLVHRRQVAPSTDVAAYQCYHRR